MSGSATRGRVPRQTPFQAAGWNWVGNMTHTVCEPCNDCKYTDCVAVCPVECFYQDELMLYIDPADCIDCEACVPECPVEAIFAEAHGPPSVGLAFFSFNSARRTPRRQKRFDLICVNSSAIRGSSTSRGRGNGASSCVSSF